MKKHIILPILVFVAVVCHAQTFQITNYNRASVAVFAIPNAKEHNSELTRVLENRKEISLSGRYFNNPTDYAILRAYNSESDINSTLRNNHIAAKSLMPWRNIDTLVARASYNLTMQQKGQLASSIRGSESVKDERWFKQLLQSNYILVISINSLTEMKNVYATQELIQTGMRFITGSSGYSYTKEAFDGYTGEITAYLYHVTMDDADYATFMQYWNNDSNHLSHNYGFKLVERKNCSVGALYESSLKYDNETLLRKFVSVAADQALFEIGNTYFPIAPKTMVMSRHPVKAEMGTKEDLNIDDLIYAYEIRENSKGEISYAHKATYRVKEVANNTLNGAAMSTFYNVNWGWAKEGMVLVPKEDKGVSLYAGAYVYPKTVFRMDLGLSLDYLSQKFHSKRTKMLVNFGFSGALTDDNGFFNHYADLTHNDEFRDANGLITVMYGLGFQQDIYLLPFMQLSPYFLIMIEHSWYKNKSMVNDAMGYFKLPYNYGRIAYPQVGLKVPINITYYIKLVPEISYAYKFNSLSFGAGSSSHNDGTYSVFIEKNDRVFAGGSIQIDF